MADKTLISMSVSMPLVARSMTAFSLITTHTGTAMIPDSNLLLKLMDILRRFIAHSQPQFSVSCLLVHITLFVCSHSSVTVVA